MGYFLDYDPPPYKTGLTMRAVKRCGWFFQEYGYGEPLLLIHGIGMSHVIWNPVIPLLAKNRKIIAVDILGFGKSSHLPNDKAKTVAHLVDSLEEFLVQAGIEVPIDMVGNSLGGLIALEAAKRGLAKHVVAISPAGLWDGKCPAYAKTVLTIAHSLSTRFHHVLRNLVRLRWFRDVAFAIPLAAAGRKVPSGAAIRIVDDLASSDSFKELLENIDELADGGRISVPVAVAFGKRDFLLRRESRDRSKLPSHAKWYEFASWGHVPTWDDPRGVAKFVLQHCQHS